MNIRVTPNGTVAVSANRRIGLLEIDRIIENRADWIARARQYYDDRPAAQMPCSFITGEPVRLLGRTYHLQVAESNWERGVPDGEKLLLHVKKKEVFATRKRVFESWYRASCEAAVSRAVQNVFPLFECYQIPMPQFRLRKMKTRWGSCSPVKRVVTINLYLAQAPMACLEYVIAHELAHFVYADHSKNFYHVLSQVMPDYKQRKLLLTEQKINCYEVKENRVQ